MTKAFPEPRAYRRKLLQAILLPVLVVGGLCAILAVQFLTPPLLKFIEDRITAELRLATRLGIAICDNHFNYLLELRLEGNPEFNAALKTEAVEEIKAISRQFHQIQMIVIEGRNSIIGHSQQLISTTQGFPVLDPNVSRIEEYDFWGHPVKAHLQVFPFWDWTIVSYTLESDYLAPIRMARRVVYLGTFGVLAVVWIVLLIVVRQSISSPLKQLVSAAEDVAGGRFSPLPLKRNDEIGRVVDTFNFMVDQLDQQTRELTDLIGALRDSEGRYRDLFEGAREGILVANAETLDLVFANPAICRMLGYSESTLTKMRASDVHPEDQVGRVLSRLTSLTENSNFTQLAGISCIRSDGGVIQADIKVTRIVMDGAVHYLSYFTDVTEQVRSVAEKRELETRLLRAEKMEAIGLLAGGVAHDLNNILSGLVSYPELLLSDLPEDSPLRKPLQTIERSGTRAAAIVQDLLTLARRGVSVSEVVNLNSIIDTYRGSPEFVTIKDLHPKISFTFDLTPDLLNILGSPIHLSKTIMNLMSNAAEASTESGGCITVKTRNRYIDCPVSGYDKVDEGDYVMVTVADEGIGISPEDLPRIFEPFYSKKVMGRSGTGLGMAVVWGTVKDHRGYINVTSETHIGTTFELYFPVTRCRCEGPREKTSLDALKGSGEHVLVVDDIAEQREIASEMLSRLGYSVDTVASGEAAAAFVAATPVDLVVLDMIMDPGMDGLDTYRSILYHRPGQRAIITSGFSETDRVKEAQRLGAREYIRKPYTLEAIGRAVKNALTDNPVRNLIHL